MLPYVELLGKQIPMYGVCLMTGILIAGVFAYLESKKRGVIPENLIIIAATAIGLGMVGAKGMYIIVSYSPAELMGIIKEKNFSLLLQGGFVFYVGVIFGILGAVLGCKMASVQIGDYENIVVKRLQFICGRNTIFHSKIDSGQGNTESINITSIYFF